MIYEEIAWKLRNNSRRATKIHTSMADKTIGVVDFTDTLSRPALPSR